MRAFRRNLCTLGRKLSMGGVCAGGCEHRLQQFEGDTVEAAAERQGSDVSGVCRKGGLCEEGERPVCGLDRCSKSTSDIPDTVQSCLSVAQFSVKCGNAHVCRGVFQRSSTSVCL